MPASASAEPVLTHTARCLRVSTCEAERHLTLTRPDPIPTASMPVTGCVPSADFWVPTLGITPTANLKSRWLAQASWYSQAGHFFPPPLPSPWIASSPFSSCPILTPSPLHPAVKVKVFQTKLQPRRFPAQSLPWLPITHGIKYQVPPWPRSRTI